MAAAEPVPASGVFAFWAKPAGGAAAGGAAAGVLAGAGELAGAFAPAGVSQTAANAIAHPIRFIDTPEPSWNRKRRTAPPEVGRSIGAALHSLKRPPGGKSRGVEGVPLGA